LTQEQISNAQTYIKGHVVGETFHDDYHYDDSFGHEQQMFTVNKDQYFDPNYDPNSMKGGITPNTWDLVGFLPAKGIIKGGIKNITKLPNGKTKVKLDNGQTVEVPQSSIKIDENGRPTWRNSELD